MDIDKIYLGDAYKLIKEAPDKSVDLIVTDPPYLGAYGEGGGAAKEKDGTQKDYVKKIKEEGLYDGFDLSILDEFVRVMKKINIYLFCSKEQIYDYLTYFTKQRRCNWELIVLAKDNPPPFCHLHYLKDKEYCLYFWETGVRLNTTTQNAKTVYFTNTGVAQADKKLYDHPTIKPLELIKNLIEISSSGGG